MAGSIADTWAGIAQVADPRPAPRRRLRPVGDWMAHVYTPTKHSRVERGVYG